MTPEYPWRRYWSPADQAVGAYDGLTVDPETRYGTIVNKHLVPSDEMPGSPCTVLLGGPGLGKSTELKGPILRSLQTREGAAVRLVDLKDVKDAAGLDRRVFKADWFTGWAPSVGRLRLMLDGLDEGLFRFPNLFDEILERLRELSAESAGRLELIVSCRTVDWKRRYEASLRDALTRGMRHGPDGEPDAPLRVFELTPLRRADIAAAAKVEGVDPDEFLAALDRAGASRLAGRPSRLRALFAAYKNNELPSGRVALFRLGCLKDCEEWDEDRFERKTEGRFGAKERLMAASRIAAVSLFSGRPAVRTTSRSAEPGSEVVWDDVTGGEERAGDETAVAITSDLIAATIKTALFTTDTESTVRFVDRVTQEFLAGLYLRGRGLHVRDAVQLFRHPGDETGPVAPPLAEAAAWLADMDRGVLRELIEIDPQVLLRGDLSQASPEDRERLVTRLLAGFDTGAIDDADHSLSADYGKLGHLTLAKQLAPYVESPASAVVARRFAIQVARDCEVVELVDVLTKLALCPDEDYDLRVKAALAVAAIGRPETTERLEPLSRGAAGADPDHRLRGAALHALWRSKLSTAEVFSRLVPPSPHVAAAYEAFLSHLEAHLAPDDLPAAMDWARRLSKDSDAVRRSAFGSLHERIYVLAWKNADRPAVAEALAEHLLAALEGDRLWHDNLHLRSDTPDSHRRAVLEHLIRRVGQIDDRSELALVFTGWVRAADADWLLPFALGPEPPRSLACGLLARLSRHEQSALTPSVLAAMKAPSGFTLAEAMARLSRPEVSSPDQAAEYERPRPGAAERSRPSAQTPPSRPDEAVSVRLDEAEKAPGAFPGLIDALASDGTGASDVDWVSDLTALPGWAAADEATRARVVAAARRYALSHKTAPAKKWLGTDHYFPADFAGFPALRLLLARDPDAFAAFDEERWRNWIPVLLAFPMYPNAESDEEDRQTLVREAYARIGREVSDLLATLVRHESERGLGLAPLEAAGKCWSSGGPLGARLLEMAADRALTPRALKDLLVELLSRDVPGARELAAATAGTARRDPERALAAAEALWKAAADCGWADLQRPLRGAKFRREFLLAISDWTSRGAESLIRLTEQQLATLYRWLLDDLPSAEGPPKRRTRGPTPSDSAARFRGHVLETLRDRGTAAAVGALERLAAEHPDLSHLPWEVRASRRAMLRATWAPLTPSSFREATAQPDVGLVRSDDELLLVVERALGELQCDLHGETPAARFLWDRQHGSKRVGVSERWRPVDEETLSDFVKRHLTLRLTGRAIASAREVVIRRGFGGEGERTDILVQATVEVSPGRYAQPQVIVEVKGCWNKEVLTAMQGQLVGRYLDANSCRCGLYLVGWFDRGCWDEGDPRRAQVRSGICRLADAKELFDSQAERLSVSPRSVKSVVLDCSLVRPRSAELPSPPAGGRRKARTPEKGTARRPAAGAATTKKSTQTKKSAPKKMRKARRPKNGAKTER